MKEPACAAPPTIRQGWQHRLASNHHLRHVHIFVHLRIAANVGKETVPAEASGKAARDRSRLRSSV
jgi:hypothetical protein